jgi:hypothetical protein
LLLCGPPVVLADLSWREVVSVPLELGTRPASCDLSPDGCILVVAQVPQPAPQAMAASGLNAWLEATSRLFCRLVADPANSLWSVVAGGRVTDPPLFLPDSRFMTLERRHEARFVTRELGTGAVLEEAQPASAGVFDNQVMCPDGRLIACHRAVQVAVYRVEALAANPVAFANDNPRQFTGLAFHPSGLYLAAASNDAPVKFYNTATWKVAQAFDWGIGRLRSVAFSPDGLLAAAGGDEGRIVVWDVDL